MERINKDKVVRLWSLIVFKNGKSKYKKDIPNLVLFSHETNSKTVGEYHKSENCINIWWRPHSDFKDLASTMLHEYAHYLQFWPWYSRYEKMYSYEKNPYEIEANEFETHAPEFIKGISDDCWKSSLRKNPKLKKIYEKYENEVVIK